MDKKNWCSWAHHRGLRIVPALFELTQFHNRCLELKKINRRRKSYPVFCTYFASQKRKNSICLDKTPTPVSKLNRRLLEKPRWELICRIRSRRLFSVQGRSSCFTLLFTRMATPPLSLPTTNLPSKKSRVDLTRSVVGFVCCRCVSIRSTRMCWSNRHTPAAHESYRAACRINTWFFTVCPLYTKCNQEVS
jgi:hypothetical protein